MQAEKMPYYTEDGLKAAVSSMFATPFVKIKFDGSNTVLFTVMDKDGNENKFRANIVIPNEAHARN